LYIPVSPSRLACATNHYTQSEQSYEYPGVRSYNRGTSQADNATWKSKRHMYNQEAWITQITENN